MFSRALASRRPAAAPSLLLTAVVARRFCASGGSNMQDHLQSRAVKKRNRKTMDQVLNDVMTEAMKARDRGERPDMDFVYKKSQEKLYEAEHGKAPPTSKGGNQNYRAHIPFAPELVVRRVAPFDLFDDDPWPQRSYTATPGVPEDAATAAQEEAAASARSRRVPPRDELVELPSGDLVPKNSPEAAAAGVSGAAPQPAVSAESAADADPSAPASPPDTAASCDPPAPALSADEATAGFIDALDELAHWEQQYLVFLRAVPVWQRRSLPLFQDRYKHLTHRLHRAECRFIACRDRALAPTRASPAAFEASEVRVERCRKLYVETHKSLTHNNYDPRRMKKSFSGPILAMTDAEFEAWKESDRAARYGLIEGFSAAPPADGEAEGAEAVGR